MATSVRGSPQVSTSDGDIILVAKGGGIAFTGNLLSYAIRFIFGIMIARMLGAELLGLYSLGTTIPEVMGALAILGLSTGMARYIPIAIDQKDERRLWGVLQQGIVIPTVISLFFTAGIFLFAEPLSRQLFGQPLLAPVLRLACLGIPLLALIEVLSAITQGFKRMEYKVYAQDITSNVLKLLLSAAFIAAGWSVMGAVNAYVIALAVTTAMLFYFVDRLFPLRRPWHTARRNTREMLGFTLPLYLSQFLAQFSGSIQVLLLGVFGAMSGVGIYIVARRLSEIGSLFYLSLQRIVSPMVSGFQAQGNFEPLKQVYQASTKWGMMFNLPVFLTVALLAEPLLAIFGATFVAGAPSLVILSFATLFDVSTGMCGLVVTMTGHTKLTFINTVLSLAVIIGLDLLFIPLWGVTGAALAGALGIVIINSLRIVEVFVLLRMWPCNLSFLKPLAAAGVAGVAGYVANQWLTPMPVLLHVSLGTAILWSVYALAITCLGLSKQDRLILDRLWNRLRAGRLAG